jgi:hypothetical protein
MALFAADAHFVVYMDARSSEPSMELHSRAELAPVFDDLNRYVATTQTTRRGTLSTARDNRCSASGARATPVARKANPRPLDVDVDSNERLDRGQDDHSAYSPSAVGGICFELQPPPGSGTVVARAAAVLRRGDLASTDGRAIVNSNLRPPGPWRKDRSPARMKCLQTKRFSVGWIGPRWVPAGRTEPLQNDENPAISRAFADRGDRI